MLAQASRSDFVEYADLRGFAAKLQETSPGTNPLQIRQPAISADKAIPGVFHQRAVTNAAKHAYPQWHPAKIQVTGGNSAAECECRWSRIKESASRRISILTSSGQASACSRSSRASRTIDGRITVSSNQPKGAALPTRSAARPSGSDGDQNLGTSGTPVGDYLDKKESDLSTRSGLISGSVPFLENRKHAGTRGSDRGRCTEKTSGPLCRDEACGPHAAGRAWSRTRGSEVLEDNSADGDLRLRPVRADITWSSRFEMPGFNGRLLRLAHAVRGRWPPIKILAT